MMFVKNWYVCVKQFAKYGIILTESGCQPYKINNVKSYEGAEIFPYLPPGHLPQHYRCWQEIQDS